MPQRILIVEDDETLLPLLLHLLQNDGLEADVAQSGAEMHDRLKAGMPDLVVLDLGLPDESGLALARQLRARSDVAILVLTASQEKSDLLAALELGVDDFVTKPFDPQELSLRIRNILVRRVSSGAASGNCVSFSGWTLNFAGRALRNKAGDEVPLTPGEFNILSALVRAPGRVLSRDVLLDAIAQGVDAPLPRMIDVHISQLRKKMERENGSSELIATVKGAGYRFDGTPE